MTLTKISDGVYADRQAYAGLEKSDAIIFDCDGVLIDVSGSYDLAIISTARHILRKIEKIDNAIKVNSRIIDGFKSTGGFNDEVDLTYAAILSIKAADMLGKDQATFVFDVIRNSGPDGIKSVESYLGSLVDISEIKTRLGYPDKDSLLRQIFDQLFYGPRLYEKLFSGSSEFSEPGLIEKDDVILDDRLIEMLKGKFAANIAMVTGRGRESARHSLGRLLDEFNLERSFFLEDEPRMLAKPNPKPLLDSILGMNGKYTIYVGDSMEDLIMAQRVTKLGSETTFCGIMGTSSDPQQKLRLFEDNGATLVLDSIKLLPKVLNLE